MTDAFSEHRALLFGLGYRLLGSVADAEDLVQETYLRWQSQPADTIANPKAWLITTLTRIGIDQLRSARRRREEYVGTWLPEPIVDAEVSAPDQVAAMADSLGMAFLVLLEALDPVERAVFLLREVFDQDYAEIAAIVGKNTANCRQIVSRVKRRLAGQTPAERTVTAEAEQIVQQFMRAVSSGDLSELLALLTDDAVLYVDGGSKVRSARRPVATADHIGRFFIGIRARALDGARVEYVRVNGETGMILRRRDGVLTVSAFAFSGGRISAIYTVGNPDKLRHLRRRLDR